MAQVYEVEVSVRLSQDDAAARDEVIGRLRGPFRDGQVLVDEGDSPDRVSLSMAITADDEDDAQEQARSAAVTALRQAGLAGNGEDFVDVQVRAGDSPGG